MLSLSLHHQLLYKFALTSEWDTVAAQAVVEGAGGSELDTNGNRLIYQKDYILNLHFIVSGQANYF